MRKTNPYLVETILASKRKENWKEITDILSRPRRKMKNCNLSEINEKAKENEFIVIPGKILSTGEINKKLKIAALNFSKKAKEKLLKANCKISTILEEIKKNPEAKDFRILNIKNENYRR